MNPVLGWSLIEGLGFRWCVKILDVIHRIHGSFSEIYDDRLVFYVHVLRREGISAILLGKTRSLLKPCLGREYGVMMRGGHFWAHSWGFRGRECDLPAHNFC